MGGGGGGVVSAVTAPVTAVVNKIPVIGTPIAATAGALSKGVDKTIDAPVNALSDLASGKNVGQTVGNAGTATAAGYEQVIGAPIASASTFTPQGVQELPILSNLFQENSSASNIVDGKTDRGDYLTFYRNTAEIGAAVATLGTAAAAEDGAGTVTTDAGIDSAGSDVAAGSVESSSYVGTETGLVEDEQLAGASAQSSGILGTGITPAEAGVGGLIGYSAFKKNGLAGVANVISRDVGAGDIFPTSPSSSLSPKTGSRPIGNGGSVGSGAISTPYLQAASVAAIVVIGYVLIKR